MNNLAVVAHAAEDLRIEDIGAPAPRPDEAVVDIAYGGICGSDLHYWRHGAAGASVLREPMILGHEVSGVVCVAAGRWHRARRRHSRGRPSAHRAR